MAGGNGGGLYGTGGAGGRGYNGQAGSRGNFAYRGSKYFYGGGGGGAAGGGSGGAGYGGAAGGAGGTSSSLNGQAGGNSTGGQAGGGGGGGGFNNVNTNGTALYGYARGGNGGRGGNSSGSRYSGAGGGGAGGYGVTFTGRSLALYATVVGGTGGAGGDSLSSASTGGTGGDGGVGFFAVQSGTYVANKARGVIEGGQGGAAGQNGVYGLGGAGLVFARSVDTIRNAGVIEGGYGRIVGGAGIIGSNLTVDNTGSIAGGSSGVFQGAAIDFTGGSNSLSLSGSISGNIQLDNQASLDLSGANNLTNNIAISSSSATIGAVAGNNVSISGTIEGSNGEVIFGSARDTGRVEISSGFVNISEIVVAGGSLAAAAALQSNTTVKFINIDSGATFEIDENLKYGGTLDVDAGIIDLNSANLSSTGFVDLSNATITGSKYLAVANRGSLEGNTVASGSTILLVSGDLIDTGNLSLSGRGQLFVSATGTFDIANSGDIGASSNANKITNNGELEKTVGGQSFVTGPIKNNGQLISEKGTLDLTGAVTGEGTLDVFGTAAMELGGMIAAHQTVVFHGSSDHLKLDAARDFHGSISGLRGADAIGLTGFDDRSKLFYDASSHTLSVHDGGQHTFSAHLDGSYRESGFSLTRSATGEVIQYSSKG